MVMIFTLELCGPLVNASPSLSVPLATCSVLSHQPSDSSMYKSSKVQLKQMDPDAFVVSTDLSNLLPKKDVFKIEFQLGFSKFTPTGIRIKMMFVFDATRMQLTIDYLQDTRLVSSFNHDHPINTTKQHHFFLVKYGTVTVDDGIEISFEHLLGRNDPVDCLIVTKTDPLMKIDVGYIHLSNLAASYKAGANLPIEKNLTETIYKQIYSSRIKPLSCKYKKNAAKLPSAAPTINNISTPMSTLQSTNDTKTTTHKLNSTSPAQIINVTTPNTTFANVSNTSTNKHSNAHDSKTALYAGIIISGIILVACIVLLILIINKRSVNESKSSTQYHQEKKLKHDNMVMMSSGIKPVLDSRNQNQNLNFCEPGSNENEVVDEFEPEGVVNVQYQTQGFQDIVADAACGDDILMDEIVGQMSQTEGRDVD